MVMHANNEDERMSSDLPIIYWCWLNNKKKTNNYCVHLDPYLYCPNHYAYGKLDSVQSKVKCVHLVLFKYMFEAIITSKESIQGKLLQGLHNDLKE